MDLSEHSYKVSANIISFGIYFLAVLAVFWLFGLLPALYTLLTAAGFVGIVIGFGLKDVLSNFVSGIIIALDRPFRIGDEIEVKEFGGVVEDVNIRMTTIRVWDGRLVYMPNSMMLNTPVINLNRSGKRQVTVEVKFDPAVDLGSVLEEIKKVYEKQKIILIDPAPTIVVDSITTKEVVIRLKFWFDVKETDYLTVKSKVMKQVGKIIP